MQEVDTTRERVCVCAWVCVCVLAAYSVCLCPVWERGRGGEKTGSKKDSPAGVINICDHTLSRIKAKYVCECSTD